MKLSDHFVEGASSSVDAPGDCLVRNGKKSSFPGYWAKASINVSHWKSKVTELNLKIMQVLIMD